ncbi:hypothetical protein [Psychrobacter sp. SWN149]|uniref:hypothetical protein n=1 Tax=Psychrobacter sp. SWN149 TaxID=2792057 RepID=UPI0018CF13AC|nr:hypothetical protein [Psychrobacter sp. SWN149]MBH0005865.1 hypothetical protein [Psychrobacter sp. SWN149]
MAAYFSFSKLASATLIGSMMTGSLLGCQPNKETPEPENVVQIDEHETHEHAEHEGEEHEGHDHEEHEGHDDHEGHDHEEHDDHKGHDHASAGTPFSCEPTATIYVSYHNDSTPQTATLLIDDLEYDLTAAADSDADKAIYMSDIGLDDTHGIIWQVNSDKATLLNKTLGSNVAIEKEEVLFNCQKS